MGITLNPIELNRAKNYFALLFLFLVHSVLGNPAPVEQKINCDIVAKDHLPPVSEGEWVLRCRYKDAQPQYLRSSLIRVLSRFSPEPVAPSGAVSSFAFLEVQAARNAIFEAYGLYFDDRNENKYIPAGLNSTEAKAAPIMVDEDGKVAISRYVFAKKNRAALSVNCLVCHTSIVPSRVDGVPAVSFATPNVFIDMQRVHEAFQGDLQENEQEKYPGSGAFGHAVERNPRGNSFVNGADYYGVLAGLVRDPFPRIQPLLLLDYFFASPKVNPAVAALAAVAQAQPFLKTQSWGNYRYKQPLNKLYVDGGFSGNTAEVTYRLAFSINPDGSDYLEYAHEFEQQVPQYLSKIEPPKYPFAVHAAVVTKGHQVYARNCAECHGSFQKTGSQWTLNYTGEIVADVGTDDQRFKFFTEVLPRISEWKAVKANGVGANIVYNQGYIAPPLVGIWARAPYLHNGSVANVRQLLGPPGARYNKFGVWPRPASHQYYDQEALGWKAVDLSTFSELDVVNFKQSSAENNNLRVYDQSVRFQIFDKVGIPGLKNSGHDLGSSPFNGYLTPQDTDHLIEFLKTI